LLLDFIATLIATLVGVYAAFILGVRHERQKKQEDYQETQRQILTSIGKELETNLNILNDVAKLTDLRGAHMFLWTDAYQSSLSGGDIVLLDPRLQTKLAVVYLYFRQLERYGQKLIDLMGMSNAETVEKGFVSLMEQTTTTTLKFIPMALQAVDTELKRLGEASSQESATMEHGDGQPQSQGASQPRDVETEKLKFFWDYERSILTSSLVMIFSAFIAAGTILNTQVASSVIHLSPYYEDSALLVIFAVVLRYLARLTMRFKRLVVKADGLLSELRAGKTITSLRELCEVKSEPTSIKNEIALEYGKYAIPALLVLAVAFFIIGILFH
jgi:hypothetical protein